MVETLHRDQFRAVKKALSLCKDQLQPLVAPGGSGDDRTQQALLAAIAALDIMDSVQLEPVTRGRR
jgi:hypothetical protein